MRVSLMERDENLPEESFLPPNPSSILHVRSSAPQCSLSSFLHPSSLHLSNRPHVSTMPIDPMPQCELARLRPRADDVEEETLKAHTQKKRERGGIAGRNFYGLPSLQQLVESNQALSAADRSLAKCLSHDLYCPSHQYLPSFSLAM